MKDNYHEEKDLKMIKDWDIHDPRGLVEFLEEIWWTPEFGFHISRGRSSPFQEWVMRINLSTGGWSGNEEIISTLRETMFWVLYWHTHRRGGHYTFEIPINTWKNGFK